MTLLSRRGAIANGGTVTAGDVTVLDDLSDVTITTPADGDALILTAGTWENSPL